MDIVKSVTTMVENIHNMMQLASGSDIRERLSRLNLTAENLKDDVITLMQKNRELLKAIQTLEDEKASLMKSKEEVDSLCDYVFPTGALVMLDREDSFFGLNEEEKRSSYVVVNDVRIPKKRYCAHCAENGKRRSLQMGEDNCSLYCQGCGSTCRFFTHRFTAETF